jgi:hypothetical protein
VGKRNDRTFGKRAAHFGAYFKFRQFLGGEIEQVMQDIRIGFFPASTEFRYLVSNGKSWIALDSWPDDDRDRCGRAGVEAPSASPYGLCYNRPETEFSNRFTQPKH